MIRFFNNQWKRWAIMLSCVSLFVMSCDPDESSVKRDFSGEEIFKGIFFLQGEVTEHLETIKPQATAFSRTLSNFPEARLYHENFAAEIIQQINRIDKDYFTQFKAQVSSKNYYAIDLAIRNARKMMKVAGYQSKYATVFTFIDEAREKKVDFNSDELKSINISKSEDREKLKKLLKDTYEIDLDGEEYKVANSTDIVVGYVIPQYPVIPSDIVYPGPDPSSSGPTVIGIMLENDNPASGWAWMEAWGGTGAVGCYDALVSEIASSL